MRRFSLIQKRFFFVFRVYVHIGASRGSASVRRDSPIDDVARFAMPCSVRIHPNQGVVDQRRSFRRRFTGDLLRLSQTWRREKAVRGVQRNGEDAAGTTAQKDACVCAPRFASLGHRGVMSVSYHYGGPRIKSLAVL